MSATPFDDLHTLILSAKLSIVPYLSLVLVQVQDLTNSSYINDNEAYVLCFGIFMYIE